MLRQAHLLIILLACFSLNFLNAGMLTTAYAAQNNPAGVPEHGTSVINGKVTEVISTDRFTYAEVATANKKIWVAGPVTLINKGDMIGFSTKAPMYNFHSKILGRDFSIIYFVSRFITGKETPAPAAPHIQLMMQQQLTPTTTTGAGIPAELEIGDHLREASLDALNGKTKVFADFKGKPLIINMWASWCGPCRAEMGSLQRLAQRYNGKALTIIGISTDDYRNKAMAFIKETQISFDNFIDHDLKLENMLGAKTIPLTILVDADGRVLTKVPGSREWDSPEIVEAISKAFNIKLM
ncbi:MAG: TlpA disulfide reductase family protein [Gammaproteobacteria bacterium]